MKDLNPTTIYHAVTAAAYSACNPLAMIERHNDLVRRAAAGDLDAILYFAHEAANDEDVRRDREKAIAHKAARRKWRAAYQWAKWGE